MEEYVKYYSDKRADWGHWDERQVIMRFGQYHSAMMCVIPQLIRWRIKLPPFIPTSQIAKVQAAARREDKNKDHAGYKKKLKKAA